MNEPQWSAIGSGEKRILSPGRSLNASRFCTSFPLPSGKLDELDLAVQQIELEAEVPCFLPAGVPHDSLAGVAHERQRDRGVDDGLLEAERVRVR